MTDSFGLLEYSQDAYELADPKNAGWFDELEARLEASK